MLIVHVNVKVKPEFTEAFLTATIENARESVKERGIARFDVLQHTSEPNSFLLTEVYRYAEAAAEHKATAHYQKWRDTVAGMMAEARSSVQFSNIFPGDEDW